MEGLGEHGPVGVEGHARAAAPDAEGVGHALLALELVPQFFKVHFQNFRNMFSNFSTKIETSSKKIMNSFSSYELLLSASEADTTNVATAVSTP